MAQFRVEFVLEQASGMYLVELYNPENYEELIVRTEAVYPTQASAVLGLVELFKNAIPAKKPATSPRRKAAKKPAKKAKRRKGK